MDGQFGIVGKKIKKNDLNRRLYNMNSKSGKGKILWIKALLNGILAWIIGFILYMVPGFVIAFKMGMELGPKSEDPAMVSEQIGQTIPTIYQDNLLLLAGFYIITALLIFWRAWSIAKGTGDKKGINGMQTDYPRSLTNLVKDYGLRRK